MSINFQEDIESMSVGFDNSWMRENKDMIKAKYNINDIEIFIVGDYAGLTGHSWDFVYNKYLRNGETNNKTVDSIGRAIDKLKTAIQKFSKNNKTIRKVSKSTKENACIFQKMIQNNIRTDKGFMSCSKNPRYMKRAIKTKRMGLDPYQNDLVHTYVLKITNPTYLSQGYDISELSIPYKKTCKRNEEEVIFLPGFEGKIQHIRKDQHITYITL